MVLFATKCLNSLGIPSKTSPICLNLKSRWYCTCIFWINHHNHLRLIFFVQLSPTHSIHNRKRFDLYWGDHKSWASRRNHVIEVLQHQSIYPLSQHRLFHNPSQLYRIAHSMIFLGKLINLLVFFVCLKLLVHKVVNHHACIWFQMRRTSQRISKGYSTFLLHRVT